MLVRTSTRKRKFKRFQTFSAGGKISLLTAYVTTLIFPFRSKTWCYNVRKNHKASAMVTSASSGNGQSRLEATEAKIQALQALKKLKLHQLSQCECRINQKSTSLTSCNKEKIGVGEGVQQAQELGTHSGDRACSHASCPLINRVYFAYPLLDRLSENEDLPRHKTSGPEKLKWSKPKPKSNQN